MVFLTDSLFPTLWFVVELKQILIFSGEFLSLPLHFRAVIIMSDIENGRGGGSFYSVQDREGLGWRAGDHWLCQCEVEGRCHLHNRRVGVYHYYWSEGILDQCKKWYNSYVKLSRC